MTESVASRWRMEKAVSMERYEDAARFRDEIKKIKDLV